MKAEYLETKRNNTAAQSLCACKMARDPTFFGIPVLLEAHTYVPVYMREGVFIYNRTHVEWHGNVGQRTARSPNPNQESSGSSLGLGMLAP